MQRSISWLFVINSMFFVACGGGDGEPTNTQDPNAPQPTFELRLDNIDSPSVANAGDTITVTGSVTNTGSNPAGFTIGFYLSQDSQIDPNDDTLITFDVVILLSAGSTSNFSQDISFPANLATGNYTLGVFVDHIQQLSETNESDNLLTRALSITGSNCSDDSFEEDDTAATANSLLLDQGQAHNHCLDDRDWFEFSATAGMDYSLYAGEQNGQNVLFYLYDSQDNLLRSSSVLNWDGDITHLVWKAPADGSYRLRVSPYQGLLNSGANSDYILTLTQSNIDLETSSYGQRDNSFTYVGGAIDLVHYVINHGTTDSGIFSVSYYLSDDQTFSNDDTLVDTKQVVSVSAGGSTQILPTLTDIPVTVTAGSYYLLAVIDAGQALTEYNEFNNVANMAIQIRSLASCVPDIYEEDDIPSDSNLLNLYDNPTHNFCDDRHDWFRFNATAGQRYRISAPQQPTVGGFYLSLYDTDGLSILIR